MHSSGMVWTDLKAENFVTTDNSQTVTDDRLELQGMQGIDLESAIWPKGNPADYSVEACPPEFAKMKGDGGRCGFRPAALPQYVEPGDAAVQTQRGEGLLRRDTRPAFHLNVLLISVPLSLASPCRNSLWATAPFSPPTIIVGCLTTWRWSATPSSPIPPDPR